MPPPIRPPYQYTNVKSARGSLYPYSLKNNFNDATDYNVTKYHNNITSHTNHMRVVTDLHFHSRYNTVILPPEKSRADKPKVQEPAPKTKAAITAASIVTGVCESIIAAHKQTAAPSLWRRIFQRAPS